MPEAETENIKVLKIPIPDELPGRIMESTEVCGKHLIKRKKGNSIHHLAKPISLFLYLKAEAPGASLIQNYTKQIPALCANLGWAKRTFHYHLATLKKMDLITKDKGHLRVATWEKLGKVLDIDTKKRTPINFTCDGKQQVHRWFAALEIKSNQQAQADMVWKKAHKNSDIASVLRDALIDRGFDLARENDPEYYAGHLLMLMIEDFRFGTEVHDILIAIRSDVNRTCGTIAKAWEMSKSLVCYWKKKMMSQDIMRQATVEIMSEWKFERQDVGKNKYCRVVWDDKEKQRVWRLCKQLSIIMPGEWEEWFEKNKAA